MTVFGVSVKVNVGEPGTVLVCDPAPTGSRAGALGLDVDGDVDPPAEREGATGGAATRREVDVGPVVLDVGAVELDRARLDGGALDAGELLRDVGAGAGCARCRAAGDVWGAAWVGVVLVARDAA